MPVAGVVPIRGIVYRRRKPAQGRENIVLGTGHAVSGVTVWWTGWSWATLAGLTHPHLDVLIVGSLVASGAALAPDFDHPESRLAHAGGLLTETIARGFGYIGRNIHAATKLDADRPDRDGHRTVTHTLVFAVLAGCLVAGVSGLSRPAGAALAGWAGIPALAPLGKLITAVLVYVFVRLGFAASRAAFPGRQRRVKLFKKGRRWRKPTLVALACAVAAYALVPADVWWLGLAVSVGCISHLLGDVITAAGCPVLWPLPIPSREQRYNRQTRQREPVTRWRTWYLVGTPKWMRFRVGGRTEARVTWGIIVFGVLAAGVLVYAVGWGPAATG
jgi:membrane-bound metal-dependent hydrolase YbcI (DUF457 family)